MGSRCLSGRERYQADRAAARQGVLEAKHQHYQPWPLRWAILTALYPDPDNG